jgi:hypothetical protein
MASRAPFGGKTGLPNVLDAQPPAHTLAIVGRSLKSTFSYQSVVIGDQNAPPREVGAERGSLLVYVGNWLRTNDATTQDWFSRFLRREVRADRRTSLPPGCCFARVAVAREVIQAR